MMRISPFAGITQQRLAPPPEGGQVRRVGARKRLLSSSTRSSAGRHILPYGRVRLPAARPGAFQRLGARRFTRHLWRMWITSFSHARRLTTRVDKRVDGDDSLDSGSRGTQSSEAVLQTFISCGQRSLHAPSLGSGQRVSTGHDVRAVRMQAS